MNNNFNEEFYLSRYPDVAASVRSGTFNSGYDHYQLYGKQEGRAFFDEEFYLRENTDVLSAVRSGQFASGYQHYKLHGQAEGREIASLTFIKTNPAVDLNNFDAEYYLRANPDVAAGVLGGTIESAYAHYQHFGVYEGREPNGNIANNTGWYLDAYSDVKDAGISAISHFNSYGYYEGRLSSDVPWLRGNDFVQGNAGQNTLNGGSGNDTVSGQGGNDSIFGETGNDFLTGGKGNDHLFGGSGNDTLDGSGTKQSYGFHEDNDTIWAGDGNDLLRTGSGNDEVKGDLGNDTIDGTYENTGLTDLRDNGTQYLYGGGGNDHFVFQFTNNTVEYHAVIMDFEQGRDKIVISSDSVRNFEDLQTILSTNYYGKALISQPMDRSSGIDGHTITVNNLHASSLTENDFIFA